MSNTNNLRDGGQKSRLSALRDLLFPIYGNEIPRFIAMVLLMSCLLFAYTTGRILKDTLVVSGSGAQAISFVKTFVVTPASLLSAMLIASLSKSTTRRNTLVAIWLFYGVSFLVYAHLVYPYSTALHMSEESIVAWQEAYPRLRSLIAMTGNWSVTLFYTLVDVSGVNVVTFAFWQVAAQVTSLLDSKDVKRIYGAYAMYGNILGIIGAGYTGTLLGAWLSPEMLIRTRVTLIGIALLTAAGIYMYIYHVFLTEAEQDAAPTKSSKPKLSMAESVRLIAGSRYLACLAVIVLSYGVAINLVEVTWKDSLQTYCLQQCHGDKALSDVMFAGFLNELYTTMGFITFLTGIVGGGLTRRMGWLGAALITPGVLAITSLLFYVFALLSNPDLVGVVTADKVAAWCAVFGCTPLVVAVYSGYAQNILSKSTKYVLFDPSTQMTYAPLHEDLRVTGKAAIDVLGSKFGKIAGAVLQTALSILTGCTQQQLAPILMVAVMCVIIAWVYATIALKPMYEAELEAAERRKSEK